MVNQQTRCWLVLVLFDNSIGERMWFKFAGTSLSYLQIVTGLLLDRLWCLVPALASRHSAVDDQRRSEKGLPLLLYQQ